MAEAKPTQSGGRHLRWFLRMALGFWSGASRRKALILSAGLLACLVANLLTGIAVNVWNKYFFDALQNRDDHSLLVSIGLVAVLSVLSAIASVALLEVRMRLQLRWRQWLAARLVRRWMSRRRFYQLSILGLVDNPEGRIAEDGRVAIELFVDFVSGMLNAVMTAVSFVGVLWFVGGSITIWGIWIPGYLVIAVIIYSGLTSYGMLVFGRPLVARVESKSAGEADFRYQLTRTRENAETIALIGGDEDERTMLGATFGVLARRWVAVINQQAKMLFQSSANAVWAPVAPLLLGAPKYLSGEMTLGDLMQAAAAFAQVQMALNWLADNALRLADWFASARRVAALDMAFETLDLLAVEGGENTIELGFSHDGAVHLEGLSIAQHDGKVMLADADARIDRGEKILVKGDSGTGKSTLIRAMAGLWPWGSGRILRPADARISFMPQRPYLPLGTLRAAINYPQDGPDASADDMISMLQECGLAHLAHRLDDDVNWSLVLSGGEQQRLAFARLLLKRPDIVIMDEPTSALDELSQTKMMELIRSRLRDSTVIHVAHRPGLDPYHDRDIHLTRDLQGGPAVVHDENQAFWSAANRILNRMTQWSTGDTSR